MKKATTSRRTGPTLTQRSRRVPPAKKAIYHQITGAGRSKVRRPFLGLTEAEQRTIAARLDAGVRQQARSSS